MGIAMVRVIARWVFRVSGTIVIAVMLWIFTFWLRNPELTLMQVFMANIIVWVVGMLSALAGYWIAERFDL